MRRLEKNDMEISAHIRERVIKDPSFRARLLAEPEVVLSVGSDTRIRALEDSDDVLHLVIPTQPVVASAGSDVAQQVIAKAQADASFCGRLVADPRATIAAELGVDLPDEVRIVVVQDTAQVVHIVCPTHQPVGVMSQHSASAVGSSASWGCAVTTADSPCTIEGNSFCTATAGCETVGGGDPKCKVDPDPGGPIEPGGPSEPGGPGGGPTLPSDPF